MLRVLQIEPPDSGGLISFFQTEINVEATICNGKLRINVKAGHGPGTSSWDEHDFEVTLPVQPAPSKRRRAI